MDNKDNKNSIRKVVQLCAFDSIYNDNLQKNLIKDNDFNRDCQLVSIVFENEKQAYLVQHYKDKYADLNILKKMFFWFGFNKYLSKKYSFDKNKDIVNIQFVAPSFLLLIFYIKKNFKDIILSYWGSDLLREKRSILKLLSPLYKKAKYLTFETVEMEKAFEEKIGKKYRDKYRIAKFGLSALDILDKISEDEIRSFRTKNDIPDNRTIIVIGYNRSKFQQHLEVVNSIINAKISGEKIFIVFPWTYGINETDYKNEIISAVADNYEYCFLEERLTDNEVACLRKITDVLVQVQVTDSLSATMLETLYEEKVVITGRWLPYDELYRCGIKMELVDKPDDVGLKMSSVFTGNSFSEKELEHNKEIVKEFSSWESNLKNWIFLYKDE